MKLESQVCNIVYSKELSELGIEQKSLFYWKENEIQTVVTERQMKEWTEKYLPTCNDYFSAFTLSELRLMLGFIQNGNIYFNSDFADKDVKERMILTSGDFETEVDFTASLLCYCLDNGYLTIEDCNERLLS